MRKDHIILLMFLLLLSGCVSQSNDSSHNVREVTIRLSNFFLDPAVVTVNKGDFVRINVVIDFGEHNLFIDGYNLSTEVAPEGNIQVLEFTADQSGVFKM